MSNGSVDYKLGEITQTVKDVECRLNRIDLKNSKDHKQLFTKLESLNTWRWKVVGAVGALVFLGNIIIEIAKDYILK